MQKYTHFEMTRDPPLRDVSAPDVGMLGVAQAELRVRSERPWVLDIAAWLKSAEARPGQLPETSKLQPRQTLYQC